MKPLYALILGCAMVPGNTAFAQSLDRELRVEADSSSSITLQVCAPGARLEARGDGDTDLDFVVRNQAGDTVHSDYDTTDITFADLRPSGSGCEDFRLEVSNLGDVYNVLKVQLYALGGAGSADGRNREMTLRNRTGESIYYIYWSNVAANDWGDDRLGSDTLSKGDDWSVSVDDGSGACKFDFKAITEKEREIEKRNIDVCVDSTVTFD